MSNINNIIQNNLINTNTPDNIFNMWVFGSLLSICLIIQLATGVIVAILFSASMSESYSLILNAIEINETSALRFIHANGASLFFIFLYIHIGRGLYYSSFNNSHLWMSGVTILILLIATAFLGYVLPLNQISFWAATVITNLFTEIPYVGNDLVLTIWGGVIVSDPTLYRFFALHFLLPFVISALVIVHIILLHSGGSSSPTGLAVNNVTLFPYYLTNDISFIIITLIIFLSVIYSNPLVLIDLENFNSVDQIVTPQHIQPEWYFLFAYAILRAIPNNLGGVAALVLSVTVFYILPLFSSLNINFINYPNKVIYWFIISSVFLLTWLGIQAAEEPYIIASQISALFYFFYFIFFLSALNT